MALSARLQSVVTLDLHGVITEAPLIFQVTLSDDGQSTAACYGYEAGDQPVPYPVPEPVLRGFIAAVARAMGADPGPATPGPAAHPPTPFPDRAPWLASDAPGC